MITKKVIMNNKTGLHARPASELVALVKKFESEIFIVNGDKKANAGSILNILTLGAKQGVELEIQADGADEQTALEAISSFIENLNE